MKPDVVDELLARLAATIPTSSNEPSWLWLLGMGYGGADKRGKVIGVDGVIDQDALGLDQIYVQAKRYAKGSDVGSEALQAFVGALQWKNVNRGIFITSSDFAPAARHFAETVSTRIVLINGARLADLMVRHHIGVQVWEACWMSAIDEDFFVD